MVILKTLSGVLPANEVEVMFTDVNIENNSIIEVYYDNNDVYTVSTSQSGDNVHVVTSPHNYQVGIKLLINNVDSFSPYDDSSIREEVNIINDSLGDVIDDVRTLENDYMALDGVVNNIARAVSNKQDTLTAGENITIEDNVISSTGGGGGEVPYKTGSFTLDNIRSGSGVVLGSIHNWAQYGKVVVLNITLNSIYGGLGWTNPLFRLNGAPKPVHNVYAKIMNGTNYNGGFSARLQPNGYVYGEGSNGADMQYITGTFVYITND